jgi:flavodoxin II
MLNEQVVAKKATVIGHWPNQGYEFKASKALTTDKSQFVGLSLDEDSQYNLTDDRLDIWCEQILSEYASQL